MVALPLGQGGRVVYEIEDGEQSANDTEVIMHEDGGAASMSMKCGAEAPTPEESALLQKAESEEAVVSHTFLEAHEVAEMILGVNDSVSAVSSAIRGSYDCSWSGWKQFSDRFKLGLSSSNCNKLAHKDFNDVNVCSEKNVLYLYPWEDHNEAFCINYNVCHRMNSWYNHACSVHMRRTHSVKRAMIELDDFPDDSLMHAVVGGHGSGTSLHWGDGNQCGTSHLCVDSHNSKTFVQKLSRKMHRHGSIFLDSCLSSNPNERKNLASWVAQTVGKGIRVIGAEVSFGKVQVQRFIAWYAQIDVTGRSNVQSVHVAGGASCPSWAKSRNPDGDGDCACPDDYPTCKVGDGKPCPRSQGKTSKKYFLPMCVEAWAKVKCMCYR